MVPLCIGHVWGGSPPCTCNQSITKPVNRMDLCTFAPSTHGHAKSDVYPLVDWLLVRFVLLACRMSVLCSSLKVPRSLKYRRGKENPTRLLLLFSYVSVCHSLRNSLCCVPHFLECCGLVWLRVVGVRVGALSWTSTPSLCLCVTVDLWVVEVGPCVCRCTVWETPPLLLALDGLREICLC